MSSSGSVIASIACWAASSSPSGTRTFCGASSSAAGCCQTASWTPDGTPAECRIVWISSASARSLATATCTMPAMALAFLSGRSSPGLDESGAAPLAKPDVDDIEVPGNDRLGEDLARLPRDLGPEVAVGEVREHEHPDAGGTRELGCVHGGGVRGLGRAVALLGGERRLVDEHVRLAGDVEHGPRWSRVAGEDDLAPRPRRPQHLLWRDRGPAGQLDRLAALEPAEVRSLLDAERRGGGHVEPPRARSLDEGVAVRRDPVRDLEDDHAVVAAVEAVPRPQLDELERIRELSEDPPQRAEEVDEARRAVDRERELAATKRERLQHPRQTEVVVGVEVADEHLGQLRQPHRRAQELTLRSLAAVDEDALAAAPGQGAP